MKLSRNQLSNIVFIAVILLLLFTPVGFHVRVFTAKWLSFSPDVIEEQGQMQLTKYNWRLVGLHGESFNFTSEKDKVVLVNFWATWCPPCVAEMPSLQNLYLDYKDKVEFVFVAHDKKEKVLPFVTKNNYILPIYFEQSKAPKLLATESIPKTLIIDRNGKIVIQKTGAANWNSAKIRKVLDELINK